MSFSRVLLWTGFSGCNFAGDAGLKFLERGVSVAEEEFDFQLRLEFSNLVAESLPSNTTYPLQDFKELSVFEVAEGHLLLGAYILSL